MAITRTAGRLAVNGDHTGYNPSQTSNPLAKACLEYLGIQQTEYPAKGVMGRCAMRKHQVALQPGFVVLGKLGTIHPTVRSAQHRAQRHQDHFRQIVPLCRPRARVRQFRKGFGQGHFHSQQKSRVDPIQSGLTSPCHNQLTVNDFCPGSTTSAYAMALPHVTLGTSP